MSEQPDEFSQVQVIFSLQEFRDMVMVLAEGVGNLPHEQVPPIAWQLLNEHLNGGDSAENPNGETGSSQSADVLRSVTGEKE